MAGSIRLQLIGKPCLYVDGQEITIEPRIAFEVLAKIILCGESGVTRSDLIKHFWTHLEPGNARQQIRLALHNLRNQAVKQNLSDCLILDGELLKCEKVVGVDLLELKTRSKWNLKQVEQILKPVGQGWKPEHWLFESDQLCELVENAFASILKAKHDQLLFHQLVTKATKLFPVSVQLNQLLVNGLSDLGRDKEVQEAIINFEDHWVSTFGVGDIPNIETGRAKYDQYKTVRKRSKWVTSLTVLGALASCGAIFSLNQKNAWNPPKLEIKIGKHQILDLHGQRVEASQFTLNAGNLVGFFQMSDGNFSTHWSEDKDLHILNSRLEEIGKVQIAWEDRLGDSTLSCPEAKNWIDFNSGKGKVTITTTPEFPHLEPIKIISATSFLFIRSCDHPERDHVKVCLFKDGFENQLATNLGNGIMNVAWNFIAADTIFGRYSLGRKTNWKYVGFQSDTTSIQSKVTSFDPVWARNSSGDFATEPEYTDIKQGHIETNWDHTVRIVPVDGGSYLLNVNGQEKFFGEHLQGFKDCLILQLSNHDQAKSFEAVDYKGQVAAELTSIIGNAKEVQVLGYGRSILMQKQGTGSNYVLVQ